MKSKNTNNILMSDNYHSYDLEKYYAYWNYETKKI